MSLLTGSKFHDYIWHRRRRRGGPTWVHKITVSEHVWVCVPCFSADLLRGKSGWRNPRQNLANQDVIEAATRHSLQIRVSHGANYTETFPCWLCFPSPYPLITFQFPPDTSFQERTILEWRQRVRHRWTRIICSQKKLPKGEYPTLEIRARIMKNLHQWNVSVINSRTGKSLHTAIFLAIEKSVHFVLLWGHCAFVF